MPDKREVDLLEKKSPTNEVLNQKLKGLLKMIHKKMIQSMMEMSHKSPSRQQAQKIEKKFRA